MPRVHTRTKSTRGRPEFPCRSCSEPIKPGEQFYTWKKRYGGTSYMHTSHGFPKPSMLSNRKTAVIEDAIQDFPSQVESTDEISEALQGIADMARDVGAEYEESADNMPESLQQGYQAEAMREVAQELEAWADDLESWEPDQDQPTEDDLPEDVLEDEDADKEQELADLVSMWLDDELSNAQDKLGELPEYQG
jgi:hypothetical protein